MESMKSKDCITIAIPIYNETNGTFDLIRDTVTLPLKKEIIIIDDCSRDGTSGILKEYESRKMAK